MATVAVCKAGEATGLLLLNVHHCMYAMYLCACKFMYECACKLSKVCLHTSVREVPCLDLDKVKFLSTARHGSETRTLLTTHTLSMTKPDNSGRHNSVFPTPVCTPSFISLLIYYTTL